MASFNILRTGKIKEAINITQAIEHNLRLRSQGNINESKSHQNRILVNALGADLKNAGDFQKKLFSYYDGLGIKKRADNVPMLEFLVSASPDFFKKKSPKEVDEWASHQLEFFKLKFGEQVKLAVLHLDEKTPHIHFMVSTELKSVKKYKNQKGEFFKETCSLNAKRYNPVFLKDLHSAHASHNQIFGLVRGVSGSKAKHTDLKAFYSEVDAALKTDYANIINKKFDELDEPNVFGISKKFTIEETKEKLAPIINRALKQNKVLKTDLGQRLTALYKKEDEVSKREGEVRKKDEELVEKEVRLRNARDRAKKEVAESAEREARLQKKIAELEEEKAIREKADERARLRKELADSVVPTHPRNAPR